MVDVVVVAASAVAVAIPPLPTTATTLPSCHRHHRYSAAKTKAPDDDDVCDDGLGMVVIIFAASGAIAFVPVDRCPPRLVDDRYPVAVPPPLSI